MKHLRSLFLTCIICLSAFGQEEFCYKTIDNSKLNVTVFKPEKPLNDSASTAVVFFFGGGWNSGRVGQFIPQAKYLNQYGIVCFLVDYRVKSRHQTTPIECVKDAKSAVRYIRKNHKKFNIDPNKIVASGGSAGGHLAATTALIEKFNEESDPEISCIPNALMLFNPVMDLGPNSLFSKRRKHNYVDISPYDHIRENAPPCVIFLGTNDKLIPLASGKKFLKKYKSLGNDCELHLYKNQGHGFFNYKNKKYFELTMKECVRFLEKINFIQS